MARRELDGRRTSRRDFLRHTGVAAALGGAGLLGAGSWLQGCGPGSTTPPIDAAPNGLGLQWQLASPWGIEVDHDRGVWNAGYVSDVIELTPTAVLVGTQTGGVWYLTGDTAVSLSRDWTSPDVFCLERGPDGPSHFYAGCVLGGTINVGALYVTDPTASAPVLAPWRSIPLTAPGLGNLGGVFDLLVLPQIRRIVLATGSGLFWADIPAAPTGTYTWNAALGVPAGSGFFSLCAGPGNQVVAGAYLANPATAFSGVYRGDFVPGGGTNGLGGLLMGRADLGNLDPTPLSTTSVASYAGDRQIMYAICANAVTTGIYALLRSSDGGATWAVRPAIWDNGHGFNLGDSNGGAGGQGLLRNNCITVSPDEPDVIAFGWVEGPYISRDGGGHVRSLDGDHDDHHALLFTTTGGGRLYTCSDGGLAVSTNFFDAAPTFSYDYNRRLANLQFANPAGFFRTLGVNPFVPGQVGGGLQDNDVIHAILGAAGTASPWRPFESGNDGGMVQFLPVLPTGGVLWSNAGGPIHYARWEGDAFVGDRLLTVRRARPGSGLGGQNLSTLHVDAVVSPGRVNADHELLYAMAYTIPAADGGLDVYGIWGDVEGTNLACDFLFSVAAAANAFPSVLASQTGNTIFVGMTDGRINAYGPDGVLIASASLLSADGGIARLVVRSDGPPFEAYALRTGGSAPGVVRLAGGAPWTAVPADGLSGLPATTLEIDPVPGAALALVTTNDGVYAHRFDGAPAAGPTWQKVSTGLPALPHCSDLRIVRQPDGTRQLYLSTYGWSVWTALLSV